MSLQYRADIHVLKGLAVLMVLTFHISPTIMPAGYFGVDVFFVISGFLMCSLYKPNSEGKVISAFYWRRFSSIIPAYLPPLPA
ncbi:MAG: acyltransferase [Marinobacter sp.]|uniref:acyltransferase family protein n=1 Tax=Marinobacter sp. TaxID=50741 RepID=UPI001B4E52C6|nr:acyltransferase [Marinobacter sp.]MBQ0814651.1 acyltransferase [Marinobacter sp.]